MDWRRREISLFLGWLQETKFHFWYRREGTWGVGEKFRKLPLDERDRSKVVNPPGAQKPPDESCFLIVFIITHHDEYHY